MTVYADHPEGYRVVGTMSRSGRPLRLFRHPRSLRRALSTRGANDTRSDDRGRYVAEPCPHAFHARHLRIRIIAMRRDHP